MSSKLRTSAVALFAITQTLMGYVPIGMNWEATIPQRSDDVLTPLVPIGFAFSIWGVIYLFCSAHAVWQALPAQQGNDLLRAVGWPTAALFALNTLWEAYVPLRHIDWGSLIIIVAELGLALVVVQRIVRFPRSLTRHEHWLVVVPLFLLAGWLSAAAFVNASAAHDWQGVALAQGTWLPMLLLFAATCLGASVAYRTGALSYALPVAWACLGIVVANLIRVPNAIMATAAAVCGVAVLATAQAGRRLSRLRYDDTTP